MTEWISPAAFHLSPGVEDWRVTSTGPQAVFGAISLTQAAGLVAPAVAAAERLGVLADVDLRPEAIIVRVPYRSWDGIPAAAAEFAAEVSRAAAELSLVPDPSRIQSIGIYVAQHSKVDVRPFFAAALGYADFGDTDSVDPLRVGPQLAFNPISGDAASRGRTHFDVFVPADQAQARVDAMLAAGGRLADDSHAPTGGPSPHPTTMGWTLRRGLITTSDSVASEADPVDDVCALDCCRFGGA